MDAQKEKTIIRLIWLDLRVYYLWSKYIDTAFDDSVPTEIGSRRLNLLEKEIDYFEKKMLDISKGISYNDICEIKKKYSVEYNNVFFGIVDENWGLS